MNPDIFTFGEIRLQPYPTMMVFAFFFCLTVGYIDGVRRGYKEQGFDDWDVVPAILSLFTGAIGARLVYVLLNWDNFMHQPELIFLFRFAGLSFFGAILGAFTSTYLWCRWRKRNFFQMVDLFTFYWGMGYGIVRIGCFLAGCCYGKVTDLPWGVVMQRVDDLPRHPVQLYAVLGVIIGYFVITRLRSISPFHGFTSLSILSYYGVLRFTTEFFRDEVAYWMGLTQAQVASAGLFVVSTATIIIIYYIISFNKSKGFAEK